MTQNQIAYWQLKETQRSNMVREAETGRSNRANEQETHRSNLVKEAETATHNRNTEHEAWRSNVSKEIETNRHNLVNEAEAQRSNLASEANTRRGQNLSLASGLGSALIGAGGRIASSAIKGIPGALGLLTKVAGS